ncbi:MULTISPECIES: ADP-ribosylglycohydrolase family protein [unclassified Paenibacillus]|uniref:ADP-ribosylglycohydrolase family protein n=1 Tax=unclassified Paenibacillus TaxID=185978 RepID=UPI001AE68C7E|nr:MULTISPECIES: ADP-ribosylglycohydrolase family protein [unclassified Paenibacillus]MBP1154000.1 ADP-ribosylglycohydrolase [Paenibacillus sp. PvP091]MBP1170615.1 ADP-ribosylglycohydrolase [Paenibacillus sp. PvR098]MBP2441643.1 ADP-ribosylglycohydrolase [Paenibacillus sp. PvP052]
MNTRLALSSDRYQGCLFGLAAGDALGTTVEFCSPGSFAPVHDMVGGGVFDLLPGQWTDDTSMALCLAESLLSTSGFDPVDQMTRYRQWMREGYMSSTGECFDVGNATSEAISRFEQSGEGYCGLESPHLAGNGSIMRLAPVPMFFAEQPALAVRYAALSSKTTHATWECVDACKFLAALILAALHGWSKDEMLEPGAFREWLGEEPLTPRVEEIRDGSYRRSEPPVIQGTGYVIKSLEAALWAFAKSTSYEEGALLAVNLGDDADTTGAVYGQLAGAYYGLEGIPARWVEMLAKRNVIRNLAEGLYQNRR